MKKALSGVLAALVLLSSLPTTMTASALPDNSGAESRNVAHTLYVSTAGNDNTGDGTQDNPSLRLKKRKRKSATCQKTGGDIVVEIADGTYFLENTIEFTPEDSGSDECTIYYKAAEGANPVISGGRLIEGDWQEEGGGIYSIEYQRDEKLRALYVKRRAGLYDVKEIVGAMEAMEPIISIRMIPGRGRAGIILLEPNSPRAISLLIHEILTISS